MPQINTPEYLKLGNGDTGLPGSRRIPRFYGTDVLLLGDANPIRLAVNQELFQNETADLTFFAEQILIAVANATTGAQDLFFRVLPSYGAPWTESFVPFQAAFDRNGVQENVVVTKPDPRVLILPEPFPIPPGSALQFEFETRDVGNVTSFTVGVTGYFETEPKYTKPRKSLYILGERFNVNGVTTLAVGADGRFSEPDFYPSFDFYAKHLGMEARGAGLINLATAFLKTRLQIVGREKIIEQGIPILATQDDVSDYTPLYDSLIRSTKEGFRIEIENSHPTLAMDRIDAAIVGYRMHRQERGPNPGEIC